MFHCYEANSEQLKNFLDEFYRLGFHIIKTQYLLISLLLYSLLIWGIFYCSKWAGITNLKAG